MKNYIRFIPPCINSLKTSKLTVFTLIMAAAVSTMYLLGLGYWNVFSCDDYVFLNLVREKGLIGAIVNSYQTWLCRFSTTFYVCMFDKLFDGRNLFGFSVFQLLLGYVSYYFLIRWILPQLGKWQTLLLSVLTANLSIKGILEFSTFYWVAGSNYVVGFFFTILLVYFIFNRKIKSCILYPFLIILSVIVGGWHESYTPLVILGLGLTWIILIVKKKEQCLSNCVFIRLSVSLLLLCVGFVVMLLCPGNAARLDSFTAHPTNGALLLKTFEAMGELFYYIFLKLIYSLLLFPFYIWAGKILKGKNIELMVIKKVTNLKSFVIITLLLFMVVYIALMPGVYAIGCLPPVRALSHLSFIINVYVGLWGIVVGYNFGQHFARYLIATSLATIILFGWFTYEEFPVAKKYKSDINLMHQRMLELQAEGFSDTLKVEPLQVKTRKSAYMITRNAVMHFYDPSKKINKQYLPYLPYALSPDANDWRNQAVKKYLKLDYEIEGWTHAGE